jgi:hypothetical protein
MKRNMMIVAVMASSLLFIGENIFAAGARLNVMGEARVVTARPIFTDGNSRTVVVAPGKQESVDAILAGFVAVEWVDCGTQYRVNINPRIEGIEGWRSWNFWPGGVVEIGASGILPALGNMQGEVITAGKCPCKIY